MAKRKIDKGTRVILATAAVVMGLVLGIVVIAVLNGRGGGEAPPYQPFFAGQSDRLDRLIKTEGPIFYPDPNKGERAFYLDVDGDRFLALHVLPPGGTAGCLVQWDKAAKRYEGCHRAALDRSTLARFPVLTKEIGGKTSIFVDLRTIDPPPAASPPASAPGR
jgi:hypothetical protein